MAKTLSFKDARDEARSVLEGIVEATPRAWAIECRIDAARALTAMLSAAQTATEINEVISLRGLLLMRTDGEEE